MELKASWTIGSIELNVEVSGDRVRLMFSPYPPRFTAKETLELVEILNKLRNVMLINEKAK